MRAAGLGLLCPPYQRGVCMKAKIGFVIFVLLLVVGLVGCNVLLGPDDDDGSIGGDNGDESSGGDNGDEEAVFSIGDIGPAGGLIFYIDELDIHHWTYLEVAPQSTEWQNIEWGDTGTVIGAAAQGTAIGTGASNTAAIVAHMGGKSITGTAAQLGDALEHEYEGTTYDDWFLPSRDELNAIWENIVDDGDGNNSGKGGFGSVYWSSSEFNDIGARMLSFVDGSESFGNKASVRQVRVVRAF